MKISFKFAYRKYNFLSGTYTIFAPTNAAFAKVPAATLTALGNDVTALTNVLTYHVVQGSIPSSAATNELKLTTLNKQQIRFNIYSHNNVSDCFSKIGITFNNTCICVLISSIPYIVKYLFKSHDTLLNDSFPDYLDVTSKGSKDKLYFPFTYLINISDVIICIYIKSVISFISLSTLRPHISSTRFNWFVIHLPFVYISLSSGYGFTIKIVKIMFVYVFFHINVGRHHDLLTTE